MCFGSVAAGHVWEMDFPRVVFSGRHVFSQRLTAGKHMASFRHAVATCVTDSQEVQRLSVELCGKHTVCSQPLHLLPLCFGSGSR